MKNVTVLGCGLVGSVIARDLAEDPDLRVTVFDREERSLARIADTRALRGLTEDLSTAAGIRAATADADVVVGAVPGFLGRRMLEAVIESGKPIADISFSPENPLDLDAAARQRGVTAVVDCGVSPGLSNFAAGRAAASLDEVESLRIYVGGLPRARRWPWEYGIVFSATDVIEEYTRPARVRRGGDIVVRPALSEVELLDFAGIGTLEAFLTDGLRTLIETIPARHMEEKTLRYPGHADRVRALRETGFFDPQSVEVDGVRIAPRAIAETLLFRSWALAPGEEEFTVLRVIVEGRKQDARRRHVFDLLDRTDADTGTTSMARTTGFPCSIVARMLATGDYRDTGVRGLEHLAADERLHDRLVADLRSRGVSWNERVEKIP